MPLFVFFLIAGTAELNRPPFDLVEAEQELVGGFHTEYSSIRFAIFYLAEFMNAITMAAIIVTLFLGGPNGRVPVGPGLDLAVSSGSSSSCSCLLYFFVWVRATLPRFRYDQLMDLGWKLLIPLVARLAAAARRHVDRRTTRAGASAVVVAGRARRDRRDLRAARRCDEGRPRRTASLRGGPRLMPHRRRRHHLEEER